MPTEVPLFGGCGFDDALFRSSIYKTQAIMNINNSQEAGERREPESSPSSLIQSPTSDVQDTGFPQKT